MKIYNIKNPFMCRIGQFHKGERELCVGIQEDALKKYGEYWCYIGNNKKITYKIDLATAQARGQKTYIKNTIILPLSAFETEKSQWDQDEYDKKEQARAKINQERLI